MVWSVWRSKAMALEAARNVASPTSTQPGAAAVCSRAAVLTMSPATMPWLVAPQRDGGLAGQDAGACLDPGGQPGDSVDEVQRRAHGAFGVVLMRGRGAPDGHDRVADELLDGAAVAPDDLAREVEIARQQLARLLRVAALPTRW